ncbi:uncharacterized protein LOC126787551 [Argentina anserina]|uniref:uncharacterized protein LOC126787551 n=1 Tax=Argentina anserina TaxID=57926 RepID=UPI0021768FA1|nr:uncharacterized protein LOC126787551 [Potentilla anserina]
MEDSPYQELRFGLESTRLRLGSAFLSPIPSPSTRRLSITSAERRPSRCGVRNAPAAARQLSWMSLQGWLADADEATSARAIKGGLEPDQAVAWELFTPIQRILFVAVISVAAAESKKNRRIVELKKSVEFRDQVLSNMQHKLDSLCAQISNIHQTGTETIETPDMCPTKDIEMQSSDSFGCDKIKFVDCGCWLCDQHRDISQGLVGSNDMKGSKGYEILQYKMSLEHVAEQEERRMSDLSDIASSITSAADFQLNSLALEQDMYNLRRDCEEKDGTIRELTSLLHSSEAAGSKRIAQLEDIIRRKNSTITRLKRDMAVLEQRVVHHARLQRSSYSSSLSSDDSDTADPLPKGPHMADNLLYDLDSTTSPSSDSDSSFPVNRTRALVSKTPEIATTLETLPQTYESSSTSQKSAPEKTPISTSVAPLKEITMNSSHLRSVKTKYQPVSPRRQSLSLKSHQPSPLSPFSKRPQTANPSSRPASPLSPLSSRSQSATTFKKSSTSQTSRPRQLSAGGDSKVSKKRYLPLRKESKNATPQKRWA